MNYTGPIPISQLTARAAKPYMSDTDVDAHQGPGHTLLARRYKKREAPNNLDQLAEGWLNSHWDNVDIVRRNLGSRDIVVATVGKTAIFVGRTAPVEVAVMTELVEA